MGYNRMEASKRIRARRKELGLTGAEVAERIGKAEHYYGDIERGTCGMSIDTLVQLAETLEISVDYILFGNEEGNEYSVIARTSRILRHYNMRKQQCALELMKYYLGLDEA